MLFSINEMLYVDSVFRSVDWLTVVLGVAVCVALYFYAQWFRSPPGPTGLPYLGYYPFLTERRPHLQLMELSKKYGDVFCFKVTGQLYAHIVTAKNIREVGLTKAACFESRISVFTFFQDLFGGGLFMQNGEQWKVMRKFFLQQFKELGMGKKAQEGIMQDTLKKIVSTLRKSGGKNFDALQLFSDVSNDVVYQMIFGGVKLNEDDVRDFNEGYKVAVDFTNGKKLLLAGPLFQYVLIPFKPDFRRYRKYLDQVSNAATRMVRQHEREFDRNNIRNLVDGYINERKSLEGKKDPKTKYYTERSLVASLIQFFGDGTIGIGWLVAAILHALASRPDIQAKIQSEVDDVVGRNRFPSWDDRSRLLYTNAVIYEGQRWAEFFPLIPSSECTKETTLSGCRIPKGTIILYNMWAAFHDPKVYDDPDKFDPTRFLPVDGKKPRCEPPLFFGVGKRSCAGESLTMMEILLFVTTVMQNFNLHPVEEQENMTDDWSISFRATPRAR